MEDRFFLSFFLSFSFLFRSFTRAAFSLRVALIVDVRLRRSVAKTFYVEFLPDDLIVGDSRGRAVNRPLCDQRIAIVGNDRSLND